MTTTTARLPKKPKNRYLDRFWSIYSHFSVKFWDGQNHRFWPLFLDLPVWGRLGPSWEGPFRSTHIRKFWKLPKIHKTMCNYPNDWIWDHLDTICRIYVAWDSTFHQGSTPPKTKFPKNSRNKNPPPFLAKMGFVRDQNRPKMVRWHPKPIQGPIRRGFRDFCDFWNFWCFVTPERPLPNHWLFSILALRNCNCSIGTTVYKWSEAESEKA